MTVLQYSTESSQCDVYLHNRHCFRAQPESTVSWNALFVALNKNAKNWYQDNAMGRNTIQSLFRKTMEKSGVDITDQRISILSGKKSRHISFKELKS